MLPEGGSGSGVEMLGVSNWVFVTTSLLHEMQFTSLAKKSLVYYFTFLLQQW
jgi:hypothetical protein